MLIRALKDYIIDQKKETLKKSLSHLKKQLDFDSTAIDHLHYALYKFQDAVISVLRGVSIKPHWMFALDNLVRNSVHVGLMILSPELGANLAGQEREDCVDEDDDELSNSGVSTVNSTKVKHHSGKEHDDGKFLMDQVKMLKIENAKLLNELIESQKNFQCLVKSIPHDQGMFSEALRNLTQQLSSFTRNFERSVSFGYFSDDQNRKSSLSNDASPSFEESPPGKKLSIPLFKNPQLKSPFNARQIHDARLTDWLVRHGFDEESRMSVSSGDFAYEDFMYESDKDDIRRIGLR